MSSLVVRSSRVLLPGGIRPATLDVRDGRIFAILEHSDAAAGEHVFDAGDRVVMPGVVDTHVHMNDPGRTEWEGVEHATRAAAAGGVTTVVDMPLNSIPATTTVEALEAKLRTGAGRCAVDAGFWGGVVPGNTASLEPLAARGVLGFKCFLSPSGVDEFPHVSERDLREALPVLARIGRPLLVHAELPSLLAAAEPGADPLRYTTWLDTRPPESEHGAIALLIALAREFGARIHVVHLASSGALPALGAARASGVPVSVETCPHYLTFAAEAIPDRGTAYKCAPPIRARQHREGLWNALAYGDIDLVASDHSPAPPALKHIEDGDFLTAWGGIASLQIALPVVWTGAAARGIPLERVSGWMSTAPAALAGLTGSKGRIAIGQDADLVVFDPDVEATVDAAALHHRHAVTPYAGMRLRGRVEMTLLRGSVIFDRGALVGRPRGELLGPAGVRIPPS